MLKNAGKWTVLLILTVQVFTACRNVEETAQMSFGQENRQSAEMFSEDTKAEETSAETIPEETVSQESLQEEPASQEPEDEIVTLTISAAGDVSLGKLQIHDYVGTFPEMYDLKGAGYFFESVKPIFEADDMTLVNFEGVLSLSHERVEKTYNIKGDPEYVHILTEGSIEAVSLGNNHRMDYGQQGCDDTVAALEEAGVVYAYDSYVGYYETKGLTVGFVSVNEVYDGAAVEVFLEEGIARLQQEEVDLIIACCHWGNERENYPEEYQTRLGRMCIDWGADLVIGHHPHVLQGIEEYNGRYIVYSLGNFCFGGNKNPSVKDTMIFQQTFTFVNGEKQEDGDIRIIPCYISSVQTRNDYQPTPAGGDEANRIIDLVNTYSEELGLQFDYEGRPAAFE